MSIFDLAEAASRAVTTDDTEAVATAFQHFRDAVIERMGVEPGEHLRLHTGKSLRHDLPPTAPIDPLLVRASQAGVQSGYRVAVSVKVDTQVGPIEATVYAVLHVLGSRHEWSIGNERAYGDTYADIARQIESALSKAIYDSARRT